MGHLDTKAQELYENMELLRFTTAGSVDDGKSTLIGRLLVDTKGVFEDQIDAIRRTTSRKGGEEIDLALITDGLAAEREQGITIDVAYRYFATARRKFIIADTPGHEQYTRNMVTGASTANLAIILVDARNGVQVQSRRHGTLATLLGIPHLVLAVNKMDLVGYSQAVYDKIVSDYREFSGRLNPKDLTCIPMSALNGDNVVRNSGRMPWYQGPSLLEHMETVPIGHDRNLEDFRFPVQLVLRPNLDYRGYAGKVASGIVRPGDKVVALPSGIETTVKAIDTWEGELAEAFPPLSVTLRLAQEIDLSRGDMICHPDNRPLVGNRFSADLCWFSSEPLVPKKKYLLKQTTQTVKCQVEAIEHRLDVNTMEKGPAEALRMNDIARIKVLTQKPLFYDPYSRNRATGNFIMIDELSNNTVAAGMIV